MKTALFCLLLTACGGPLFTSEPWLGNGDAGELERVPLPNDAGAELEASGARDALGNDERQEVERALPKDAGAELDAPAADVRDELEREAEAGPVLVVRGGPCNGSPYEANLCEAACQVALQGHGSCPDGVCICR